MEQRLAGKIPNFNLGFKQGQKVKTDEQIACNTERKSLTEVDGCFKRNPE